jgi:hypothetical protein
MFDKKTSLPDPLSDEALTQFLDSLPYEVHEDSASRNLEYCSWQTMYDINKQRSSILQTMFIQKTFRCKLGESDYWWEARHFDGLCRWNEKIPKPKVQKPRSWSFANKIGLSFVNK